MLRYTMALGFLLVMSSAASADTGNLEGSILEIPSTTTLQKAPLFVKKATVDKMDCDENSDDERDVIQKRMVSKASNKGGFGSGFTSFLKSAWEKFTRFFSFS